MSLKVFQSTRPRGARRQAVREAAAVLYVSIHAPTGGATSYSQGIPRQFLVSIHAPTGGATALRTKGLSSGRRFNPRAHGGRDSLGLTPLNIRTSFNPRAHGGRDEAAGDDGETRKKFQSTRPRGARRARKLLDNTKSSFNPRAHGGRDLGIHIYHYSMPVSIHAPTGGATPSAIFLLPRIEVSIHAPTGGATCFIFLSPYN